MKLLLQNFRSWNSCRIKNKERKIREEKKPKNKTKNYNIYHILFQNKKI